MPHAAPQSSAGHAGQDSATDGQTGMVRCFAGLPLPRNWQDGLAALHRMLDDQCGPDPALFDGLPPRLRWTPPANWHLTLRFLGNVPESRCAEVAGALGAVAFAPVPLALGRIGTFPARGEPRVLWLGLARGTAECARLAEAVDAALAPLGFPREARPFVPHLTLARVREIRRPAGTANARHEGTRAGTGTVMRGEWRHLLRALDAHIADAFPEASCTVRQMVLWRSDPGTGHPVHTPLAVVPARG